MLHRNVQLTRCTAPSCWISLRGTWPTPCWVSWQRTSPFRSVSGCTASRTRSSRCPSQRGSLSSEADRGTEEEEEEKNHRSSPTARRLKPNSYGISMILCHPHGSGELSRLMGKHWTHATYGSGSSPNAGSAHSLYCSGVQYGASPAEKSQEKKNSRFQWRHCNFPKSSISWHTSAWPFFLLRAVYQPLLPDDCPWL